MDYSNGSHYEAVKSFVMNAWSITGYFVIMNERSVNIVDFIRFNVYMRLKKIGQIIAK